MAFIIFVVIIGALIGTVIGEVLGLILPTGVVKDFFLKSAILKMVANRLREQGEVIAFSVDRLCYNK